MGSRSDKGWKIHLEKRADDEILFHVKGFRRIVSIPMLTVLTVIYWGYRYLRVPFQIYIVLMFMFVFKGSA